MGILSWIILGLIAGAIAKWIMPGQQGGGFILTTVLGIVGAVIGGFVGSFLLGSADVTGFDLRSLVIAVVGSLLVLFFYGLISKKKAA